MDEKIRIGIAGYGNLGRGVESAVAQQPDMVLSAVLTRRDPAALELLDPAIPVHALDSASRMHKEIDVMILCGGSRTDLPQIGPEMAALFNTVDSFDTHAAIPDYFESMNRAAEPAGHTALISVGWDPGLFSINRLMGEAVLAQGETYTFWGKGLSQGHSDALRRLPGVKAAVQYTIPNPTAVEQVRSGLLPPLTTRQKHTRECYVVLDDGADPSVVEAAIVTMPHYFADYDTAVHFISADDLSRDHQGMPHGGFVIRSGKTGVGNDQVMEYSLRLASNPEFTASVLVAYARAVHRLSRAGARGAKSVFDVAPGLLSPFSSEQLRERLL